MIKLQADKMTKAIERAKAVRPRVRVINADERIYSVTGSKGDAYTVRFAVANGMKLGECDCLAGQRGQVCYHLVSAAQVNVMVQSMRRSGASAPALPVLPAKSADERGALITDIKTTWSRRFPGESLADELMRRFRCNNLTMLATGWLRDIKAAIAA